MSKITFKPEDVHNFVDVRARMLGAAQQVQRAEEIVRLASRDYEQSQHLYNALAQLHNRELEWLRKIYEVPEDYTVECQIGPDGQPDVFAQSRAGETAAVTPITRRRKKR